MAGLFHAVSKQHNPLGSPVRDHGTSRYTFGLAISAGLAGLLYGYDTVAISGAIDFLRTRFSLDPTMEGAVISSVMLGGVIGAASAGFLSDRFGRRRLLQIGAAIFFAASLLSAIALDPFQLIMARVAGGCGIGLAAALAVTYITESAPAQIRGTLSFSFQMLAVSGIFLANVINTFIATIGTPHWDVVVGWRWMLGIGAVPAAIFFAAMTAAPESPRFLIQHDRYEEGFAVLEHIAGTDKARVMADDIADSVSHERQLHASLTDLFRPGLRRALFIGIFLAVFNQAIGMNVISYYGPVLFKSLGFGHDLEFLAAASVAGVELVVTVIGMYLIDVVGRRTLLTVGSAIMSISAIGIATSFFMQSATGALIFMMLFASAFAFSVGPIPWIMIPELFPTFLRGRATGICTAFLLATNWMIGQFTPMLFNRIGGTGTFMLFFVLDVICLIGVLTVVPETADRTLEDIEAQWQPRNPLEAARYAVSTCDMKIRRAETTLARVENERMAAMGAIEQAERDRVTALKEVFRLENEERERQEAEERERRERAAAEAQAAEASKRSRPMDDGAVAGVGAPAAESRTPLPETAETTATAETATTDLAIDADSMGVDGKGVDDMNSTDVDPRDQAREDAALDDAMASLDKLMGRD